MDQPVYELLEACLLSVNHAKRTARRLKQTSSTSLSNHRTTQAMNFPSRNSHDEMDTYYEPQEPHRRSIFSREEEPDQRLSTTTNNSYSGAMSNHLNYGGMTGSYNNTNGNHRREQQQQEEERSRRRYDQEERGRYHHDDDFERRQTDSYYSSGYRNGNQQVQQHHQTNDYRLPPRRPSRVVEAEHPSFHHGQRNKDSREERRSGLSPKKQSFIPKPRTKTPVEDGDNLKTLSWNDQGEKKTVENILKDFANEVARWRSTDRRNPTPSQFATYLSDKYLCECLDPLPKTKMVTIARKAVSIEVEKLSKMTATPTSNKTPTNKMTNSHNNNNMVRENRVVKRMNMIRSGQRLLNQSASMDNLKQRGNDFNDYASSNNQQQHQSGGVVSSFDELVAKLESQQSQLRAAYT